jgi:hypothetical protein
MESVSMKNFKEYCYFLPSLTLVAVTMTAVVLDYFGAALEMRYGHQYFHITKLLHFCILRREMLVY